MPSNQINNSRTPRQLVQITFDVKCIYTDAERKLKYPFVYGFLGKNIFFSRGCLT